MGGFAEHILHVDMDAFFVEVERLHDPSLRGRPVVVGGLGPRGVVASASYEARRHGVHSAMPTAEARRRCPAARFVAPRHALYREVSLAVFEVLESFSPLVEAISIDEAFVDVAGLRLHRTSAVEVAAEIRGRLRSEPGLPASVGCAATKFVAKLASARAKPDGVLVVPAGRELEFLHPLPVDELWGVGAATKAALAELGVATIGDVARIPRAVLESRLGVAHGHHLHDLAQGRDPRPVTRRAEARSISVEETFAADLVGRRRIDDELLGLCERLEGRLRRAGALRAHTLTLKVRFQDFTTITRSETLEGAVGFRFEMWPVVRRLVDRARIGRRPVRLLGVSASGLTSRDEGRQPALDDGAQDAIAAAAAAVKERFGDGAVVPARLLEARVAADRRRPPSESSSVYWRGGSNPME